MASERGDPLGPLMYSSHRSERNRWRLAPEWDEEKEAPHGSTVGTAGLDAWHLPYLYVAFKDAHRDFGPDIQATVSLNQPGRTGHDPKTLVLQRATVGRSGSTTRRRYPGGMAFTAQQIRYRDASPPMNFSRRTPLARRTPTVRLRGKDL